MLTKDDEDYFVRMRGGLSIILVSAGVLKLKVWVNCRA